jgi:hypothetical protein
MSRIYSANFENVAVTAAQDFFEILPADDKPVRILEVHITQSSDSGDAAAEALRGRCRRLPATVTSGSGGSSVTPTPLDAADTAFGGTCAANHTTQATTSGTGVLLHAEAFNIAVGLHQVWPPGNQPLIRQGEAFVAELLAAPADSLSMSGTVLIEEI